MLIPGLQLQVWLVRFQPQTIFPSLMLAWHCQLAPLFIGPLPKANTYYSARTWAGDMPHVETCKMVTNSVKGSPNLPLNFHSSSKQL